MTAYRDRRDGTWRWRCTVRLPDGARRKLSGTPNTDTRSAALQHERDAVAHALDVWRHPEAHRDVPTLSAWLATYWSARAPLRMRAHVVVEMRARAARHLEPTLGALRIDRIGPVEVDRLKATLVGKGLAAATINTHALATLAAALRYAEDARILTRAPRVEWMPRTPERTDFLDGDEYERLVAAARLAPLWRLWFLLGGEAGLRIGEAMALAWTDVELDTPHPFLRVDRSEREDGAVGPTKGGRSRIVPLTDRLLAELRALRRTGPHVLDFVARRIRGAPGRRTRNVLVSVLAAYCRRAGLRVVSPQSLRHTCSSLLAAAGVVEEHRAEWLGHATVATTRIYTHVTPGHLVAAAQALGAARGPQGAPAQVVRLDPTRRRA